MVLFTLVITLVNDSVTLGHDSVYWQTLLFTLVNGLFTLANGALYSLVIETALILYCTKYNYSSGCLTISSA